MNGNQLVPQRFAFSPEDAAAISGMTMAALTDALEAKRLTARYASAEEFSIPRQSLVEWIDSLQEYERLDPSSDKDEIIRQLQRRVNELEHQIMSDDPFLPIGVINRHAPCVAYVPKIAAPKHLYFMRCEGHIKIGVSQDPDRRLMQIRSGGSMMPVGMDYRRAELVFVVNDAGDTERELHAKFAHLRHTGEWFTEAPELTDYINNLKECAA